MIRRIQDAVLRMTYGLCCGGLLRFGCSSSLWLRDLGLSSSFGSLWLGGSLGFSSGGLFCGCGLLDSGLLLGSLLLSLWLLGLRLGDSWLGLLLGELGSS